MFEFFLALEDCGLSDLGSSSRWHTWEKGRLLNHYPILMDTRERVRTNNKRAAKDFQFESSWCLEKSLRGD